MTSGDRKLCCLVKPAWDGMCRECAIKHFMREHRKLKLKKQTWAAVLDDAATSMREYKASLDKK